MQNINHLTGLHLGSFTESVANNNVKLAKRLSWLRVHNDWISPSEELGSSWPI